MNKQKQLSAEDQQSLQFLKAKRQEKFSTISRQALAKKMGVSPTSLSDWESANAVITDMNVKKIREHFQFTPAEEKDFKKFLRAVDRSYRKNGKKPIHKEGLSQKSHSSSIFNGILNGSLTKEKVAELRNLVNKLDSIMKISAGKPVPTEDVAFLLGR